MKPNSFWKHVSDQKLGTYIAPVDNKLKNFAALENALGCSPGVERKMSKLEGVGLNKYPQNNNEFKKRVANWLSVDPAMVTLGNGSDELINLIPQVFIEPGDKCVVQTPTFFRVIEAINKTKGLVEVVPAKAERNFSLDGAYFSQMERRVKKCRPGLIWLCSPNNPTGEVIDPKFIDFIAGKTKALVVVDEAYQEIYDPENKFSAVRLLGKHNNLLVTKTFSKAFGLAGIRVGLAIGNKKIIEPLEKWRLNFPISTLSLLAAEAALEDVSFLDRVHKHFMTEREFLFNEMAKIPGLERGGESKTNVFILRHVKTRLFDLLLKQGILVANFNAMNGLENQGFCRVTIKTRPENEKLLMALRKISEK